MLLLLPLAISSILQLSKSNNSFSLGTGLLSPLQIEMKAERVEPVGL